LAGETIRWIITGSPGGGLDVNSRLLAPFYETALGTTIALENRAGAGGRLAARMIRNAEPDGRTIGLLNGTALLVAGLSEDFGGFHPLDDFTVLGRIAVEDPVWIVRNDSRFQTIEDVLSDGRPLVGLSEVGATSFVFASVPSDLLGIDVTYLPGYLGGQEYTLGLIRGEFDVAAVSFESVVPHVESGELVPILQLSDRPLSDHPSLATVPLLAGPEGLAARVARERGGDPEAAIERAAALGRLFRVGRLVAAPPGVAPEMARCLRDHLASVARDPAFLAAAGRVRRSISFAAADALSEEARVSEAELRDLAVVVRRHVALVRGVAPAP
jgi:tripartite-type tricarboxylate transporter receptor subunit TctC